MLKQLVYVTPHSSNGNLDLSASYLTCLLTFRVDIRFACDNSIFFTHSDMTNTAAPVSALFHMGRERTMFY